MESGTASQSQKNLSEEFIIKEFISIRLADEYWSSYTIYFEDEENWHQVISEE